MSGMISAIRSYFLLGGKMSVFWLFLGLDADASSLVFPTLDGFAEASLVGQLLCFHKFVTVSKVCFRWIAFLRPIKSLPQIHPVASQPASLSPVSRQPFGDWTCAAKGDERRIYFKVGKECSLQIATPRPMCFLAAGDPLTMVECGRADFWVVTFA